MGIKRLTSIEDDRLDPVIATQKYMSYRKLREDIQKQEDTVKKALMSELADHGEPDDKGNRFFNFQPGQVPGLEAIKRERRVSQIMDPDAAMKLIEKLELQETCLETITEVVINEEALLAANFAGTLSDEDLATIYTSKESFAFVQVKEK